MLTRKQHELVCFINDRLEETGISPSFEEMKDALDLKSKSGVHRLISALEERNFIRRLPNRARALEVLRMPERSERKAPETPAPAAPPSPPATSNVRPAPSPANDRSMNSAFSRFPFRFRSTYMNNIKFTTRPFGSRSIFPSISLTPSNISR